MSYIGYEPARKPLTSADITDDVITSAKIVDGTIANADIANSTINLTTKVTGSLPVANGGTGLTALGSANQVLAVNSGGTALAYTAVSSDYVLLATTDASSSASVSFDGYFSSTYKNYMVICSYLFPSTTTSYLRIRYRKSNADVTTSNYCSGGSGQYQHSGFASGFQYYGGNNQAYISTMAEGGTGSTYTSNYAFNMVVTIFNPLITTARKIITKEIGLIVRNNETDYTSTTSSGSGILNDNNDALSGITFYYSSGNIASGNFKLYGIK